MIGDFWEQDKKENTFRHIAVNRVFSGKNHLRLYLCPEDTYLYPIVNELLKRSLHGNIPVYLKYSRENRYDKLVIYSNDQYNLLEITNLLGEIKKDNPNWFNNMKKSPVWLSESKFKGAYIAPEKITKRDYNMEYKTYTIAIQAMMANIKNELLFYFKVNNMNDLKNMNKQEVFNIFCYFFKREIGKMGLYLFYGENGKLNVYTNSLFPGFGKSVDEDISLTVSGIEIGKRIDEHNKRYYKIPFGKTIQSSLEEYKKYESYVLDDETAYKKKFYPYLYDETNFGNSGIKR